MSPWRASLVLALAVACREPSKSDADGFETFDPFCVPAPTLQEVPFDDATLGDWSFRCEAAPSRGRARHAAVFPTPGHVLLRIDDEDFIARPEYLSNLNSFASAVGLGLWSSTDPILPDPDGTGWTLETRAHGRTHTYHRQNDHEPRLLDLCALMGLNEPPSRQQPPGSLDVLSQTYSQPFVWPSVVSLRISCPRANSPECLELATELLQQAPCHPASHQNCLPGPTHAVVTALGPDNPVPNLCTWHSELTPNGWRHSKPATMTARRGLTSH